jgi:hypothetical protein
MIEEYREESGGGKLGTDYPLKAIQAKVLETYPAMKLIARHTNVWARLMYRESEAVITTMLRLKREHGVPCLTVHDSLIVPLSKKILAQEILSEQYHKTTGVQPLLVTRQQ